MPRKQADTRIAKPKYVVLIGDVVSSRELRGDDRRALQDRLTAMIKKQNRAMAKGLVARLTITLGDEFQTVIRPDFADMLIPNLIWAAEQELRGISIRFGIGLGSIETAIAASPLMMDGSAFHNARAAIEAAAKDEKMGGVFIGFGEAHEAVLNGIARLLEHHRSEWSVQQRRVADLLRSGKRQSEAAVVLNLTKQAVSSYARVAAFEAYAEGEAAWRLALREAVSGHEAGDPRPRPENTNRRTPAGR